MERKHCCCVPGCKDIASKRHRFPKDDDALFKIWVKNVGNPRLENLAPQQIYRSYFVCDRHFAQEFIVPGTRRGLRKDAVPTLFLSTFSDDEPPSQSSSVSTQKSWANLAEEEEEEAAVAILPSCSYSLENIESSTSENIPTSSSELSTPLLIEELPNIFEKGNTTEDIPTPSTSKGVSTVTKKGILHEISVTRKKDLTPKCKILYKKAIDLARKAAKSQKRATTFQKRLLQAEKVARSPDFHNLIDHVNTPTFNFIMQQIRNQRISPKGRRFTMDEKIFSLALMKSSAKGYRFLSKIFALPSNRTLLNLLQKMSIRPGINGHIFQTLKNAVGTMKARDKCCALVFDEMAIQPNLQYNKKEDSIDGLEDYGYKRTAKMADHVNMFMLKGIAKQWKQPVAFTFSHGPAKSLDLKETLIKIIKQCQQIGLDVVCTICDQGAANQAVVNSLLKDAAVQSERAATMKSFFLVNGSEIVPLFDIPHLFKGIRNNLLTKILKFNQDGKTKFAKWEHVQDFYMLDCSERERMCPKLTDRHVFVQHMNKMKVSLCTQVFSHRVGTLMKRISQWGIPGLEKDASDTADFILFMDMLFDSLNASKRKAPASKPYKGGVTLTSQHDEFWRDSIRILETVRFIDQKKDKTVIVPSISNFIKTLTRLMYLKDMLLGKKKFSFVLTRSLNQDCLENFFSCIRSQGGCNTKPTASQFMASLKTLTVTNFMSRHSPNSNCEEDHHEGALDTLRTLLLQEEVPGVSAFDDDPTVLDAIQLPAGVSTHKRTRIEACTVNYFAGYVAKKSLQITQNCEECRKLLSYLDKEEDFDFIETRMYPKSSLQKPGSYLSFLTKQTLSRIFYILPRICKEKNVFTILRHHISGQINFNVLNCHVHKLGEIVLNIICKCVIFFWCKRINIILKGHDAKFQLFLRSKPDMTSVDPIKLLAHNMYLKTLKRKSK